VMHIHFPSRLHSAQSKNAHVKSATIQFAG
jgi:hypothetical protein